MRTEAISIGLLLTSTAAFAQVTITGSSTQVTTNLAAQRDPSISGDIVVYTDFRNGNDDIYFTNLATSTETAVATAPGAQQLHDVSGSTIVFTDSSVPPPQVWAYDIASGTSAPLAPSPFPERDPTIGGSVVAFEIYPSGPRANGDVAISTVSSGTYVVIASTSDHEGKPSVGGDLVAFERGAVPGDPDGDIVVYDLVSGAEATVGQGLEPHTDGTYVAWRTGDTTSGDIVVLDMTTGFTTSVSWAGAQTRPHVSGDILAFDDTSTGNADIVLLHLPSGATARIGGAAHEYLNDVDGRRVAYTSNQTGNFDIFVFTFSVSGVAGGGLTDDPCSDTTGLVEVHATSFERTRGKPNDFSESFASSYADGVVVVHNDRCAAAVASLNGNEVGPEHLNAELECTWFPAELLASNQLDVELRSAPGCTLDVVVYGVDPDDAAGSGVSCAATGTDGLSPLALLALTLVVIRRRRSR